MSMRTPERTCAARFYTANPFIALGVLGRRKIACGGGGCDAAIVGALEDFERFVFFARTAIACFASSLGSKATASSKARLLVLRSRFFVFALQLFLLRAYELSCGILHFVERRGKNF